MPRLRVGLTIAAIAGLAACGGRAIEDPGTGDPDSSTSTPATAAQAGKGGKSNPSEPFPAQKLGVCKPGFDRAQNPTRPCRWLSRAGVCFDDTESACACICPTDRDSVCAHGFDDGPNAAKVIYCM